MQQNAITIVGGGPVGITAALKLAQQGNTVTVLDEFKVRNQQDGRVLALSYASLEFMQQLGVDLHYLGSPIGEVHISHTGLGVSTIKASDIKLAHLGYTVKYTDVITALYAKLGQYAEQITLKKARVDKVSSEINRATVHYTDEHGVKEQLTTPLAILAEGGNVEINDVAYREHTYHKHAIISKIKTTPPATTMAYERFEKDGPFVLLPHHQDYVLVWVRDSQDSANMTIQLLESELQQLPFMRRFDKLEVIADIVQFPLRLKIAQQRVIDNAVVLIGSSAQVIHPLAAQGLNLGLRDVRSLCEFLVDESTISAALAQYANARKRDVEFASGFTHFLAKFTEVQHPLVRHLRGLGIMALGNFKWLKNKLAHSLVFGL